MADNEPWRVHVPSPSLRDLERHVRRLTAEVERLRKEKADLTTEVFGLLGRINGMQLAARAAGG